MEGGSSFNAINFNVAEYNEATGMNFTGCSTVVSVYLCPSSQRQPDGGDDGIDPNDPITSAFGRGYGMDDYGPTCYTDIDPAGTITGYSAATPYRNKASRADGLLHQGKTRIAEITDGTSNTIAIGEDAGRDPRYVSPYTEGTITIGIRRSPPHPSASWDPPGGYCQQADATGGGPSPTQSYGVSWSTQQQVPAHV